MTGPRRQLRRVAAAAEGVGARAYARLWRTPLLGDNPPSWPPVRHPFQVLMMGGAVLSGVVGMLATDGPPSLQRTLDGPLLILWQLSLAVCGLLGLIAAVMARRDGLWSILLERLALLVVGPLALLYAVVLIKQTSGAGMYTGTWAGGFGLACLARAVQVQAMLRWMRVNRLRMERAGRS